MTEILFLLNSWSYSWRRLNTLNDSLTKEPEYLEA